MTRNILLCIDESKAAIRAAEWTIANLYREGDTVHLFYVVPIEKYVVMSTDLGEIVDDNAGNKSAVEAKAYGFIQRDFLPLFQAGKVEYRVDAVQSSAGMDGVGDTIVRHAKELNPVAVVMAKHNKGAIKTLLVGSVTNHCISHCHSPLVVLHVD